MKLKMSEETKRKISLTKHIKQANHCNLSQKAIEFIDGELLGDGCLVSESIHSAKFQYSSKYFEYINYISDTLKSFGIEQSGRIRKYGNVYNYQSRIYAELSSIYKLWYINGKKIIPKNIDLTPLVCRQWYIGDGCLGHPKNGRPNILLCTYGFLISDVKWLVKQLTNLGFKTTRQLINNTIYISTKSIKDFLNYINECPVECYKYKWDIGEEST